MIRVQPAPEPADFEARVRRPGLDAIAELVGEKPSKTRTGPRRKKVADSRDKIPPSAFEPLWRNVLPDMLRAYKRICAYLSLYIEPGTGSATVDHVVPKSMSWERVYEWSNYRLACALMNSRKSVADRVLDPFRVRGGWFELEFVDCQVCPGTGSSVWTSRRAERTIEKLRLNDEECRKARREYVDSYLAGDISLKYLERRAPFIASELRRQGRLRQGDA